jgi:hypothetical protein
MLVHLAVNLVANYNLILGDATAIASTLDTCSFGDAIPLPNYLGDAIPPHPPCHYTTALTNIGYD